MVKYVYILASFCMYANAHSPALVLNRQSCDGTFDCLQFRTRHDGFMQAQVAVGPDVTGNRSWSLNQTKNGPRNADGDHRLALSYAQLHPPLVSVSSSSMAR